MTTTPDNTGASALVDLASAIDTRAGSNAGYDVQIVHLVTGEPLPIKVSVYGPDSDAFAEALRQQSARQTERIIRKGVGAQRAAPSMDDLEEDELDLLAAVTFGFTPFAAGAEHFAYSGAASAKAMYKRFPAIRDQVLARQRDRRNFLPRSAKG